MRNFSAAVMALCLLHLPARLAGQTPSSSTAGAEARSALPDNLRQTRPAKTTPAGSGGEINSRGDRRSGSFFSRFRRLTKKERLEFIKNHEDLKKSIERESESFDTRSRHRIAARLINAWSEKLSEQERQKLYEEYPILKNEESGGDLWASTGTSVFRVYFPPGFPENKP